MIGDHHIWGYDGKQWVHVDTNNDHTPDAYIEVEASDGSALDPSDSSLGNDDIYDAANDQQLFGSAPTYTGHIGVIPVLCLL